MRRSWCVLAALTVATGALTALAAARPPKAFTRQARSARASAMPIPFMFERDGEAFSARSAGYRVRVVPGGADIALRGGGAETVSLRFPNSAQAYPVAEALLDTRINHLVGPRPRWRSTQAASRVRLPQLYPGVDAVFYGTDGQLEYDLIVAPGASPAGISVSFPGTSIRRGRNGLELGSGPRTLLQHDPVAYQRIAGKSVAIPVRYRIDGERIRFEVGSYDTTQPLVIDPLLSYSTYLGATGVDRANGVAADAEGNAYVVGSTEWDDMPGPIVRPHTPRQGSSSTDSQDAYVAKLRADGSVAWISFIGGTKSDAANAVAVGPDGDVYVGGDTASSDFPATASAFHPDAPAAGSADEFVVRLAPDGTTMRYGTLLGATQAGSSGTLTAIAVDAQGRAHITGATGSQRFPANVWGSRSPDQLTADNTDAFVARISSDGARLDWARLLGGSYEDGANALMIDQYGAVYLTGTTCSTDFTVLNALYPSHFGPSGPRNACSPDGFLAYVWNDGSLSFSTYLGGTGSDWMTAVGQGLYGRVFVGGTTTSPPPPNVYKPSTGQSGVIYQIAPNGSSLFGTRFVGGSGDSQLNALVFLDENWFWVLGTTDGAGWPYGYNGYPNPPAQGHPGGGADFFLQKWDAAQMSTLGYSDTYGGGGAENATSIARNPIGDIYIAGYTRSANFPLKNAAQTTLKPIAPGAAAPLQQDGVVARFNCDIHEYGAVDRQPAEGGSGKTRTLIEDGCVGAGVSDAAWLHVQGYDAYGVAFTVDPNATGAERTAHVVTAGRSTATITQAAGAPPPPPPSSIDEIVLDAGAATVVRGTWSIAPDAMHGQILTQPDAGQPKIASASPSPANYVEFTFQADAGKPYHLWIHGRAQNDSWQNDSVYAQFSDSIDAQGAPAFRIGTTSATWVSLEECSGCGEHAWGWQDNAYGSPGDLGPDIVFATSGPHTLRLQQREDGFEIGQVVLSASAYLRRAPGAAKDDATLVGPQPRAVRDEIVLWAADSPQLSGTWVRRDDPSAAGGVSLGNPDGGAPKLTAPLASPSNFFDIRFNADAGKPYHVWLRLKADGDTWTNDSVWVQFSGAVDAAGRPIYRTGTTDGTSVSLEECSGCGEQGWGWQDNAYGSPGDLGPDVYFAASGPQTLRIQVREDGLAVDQIVLSAARYRTAAPGTAKNDTTVLPRRPSP